VSCDIDYQGGKDSFHAFLFFICVQNLIANSGQEDTQIRNKNA
jgi:hypothetical protein